MIGPRSVGRDSSLRQRQADQTWKLREAEFSAGGPSAPVRLPQLQILRYLAALMVAVAHSIALLEDRAGAFILERAHQFGLTGVNIFFLISGFIMIHTSRDDFARPGAALRFMRRRVIRIMPIYAVMSICAYLIAHFGSGGEIGCRKTEVSYLLASMLFLPVERCDGLLLPILTQGWTLNYEAFFYIVFAACLALPRRIGLSLLTVVFVLLVSLPAVAPDLVASSQAMAFYTNPIMSLFVVGIGIGLSYDYVLRSRRRHLPLSLAVSIFFAVMIAQQMAFEAGFATRSAAAFVGSLTIVSLFLTVSDRFHPSRRVRNIVTLLGDGSYSLYLSHIFVLTSLKIVWDNLGAWQFGWVSFMTSYLLACSLTGLMIFLWIEVPLTNRLRKGWAIS